LLIRGNKVIKELARRPQLPLGLAELHMGTDRSIYRTLPRSDDSLPAYTEQLEPGDRMFLYTDGVTEGRSADGSRFGIDLLSDFVIRHSHSGTPAPEMPRRPTRTITEYQYGRLCDDATIVLIEWMPPTPSVRDQSLPLEVSEGQQSQPGQAGTKRKAPSRWGPLRTAEILGAGA